MERIDRIEKAIEELVAAQKAREVQLAKTDAQLAETDAQLARTDAQLAKTDAQLAKTDAQLAETDVQLLELKEYLKESYARAEIGMAELRESQKEMQRQLGGIGNTNGEFAENFFYSSLQQKMELGGVKFDHIERNVKGRFRNLTDEFDIVLYNGDSVGILEVKNNVKSSNIKQLMTTKLQNFKTLNPGYADAKIYLGIAGFTFENADVKKEAKAAGFAVLEVQGDHHEADTSSMKAY
ncbi:hypothetical protein [Haliscomenobacter sp.]|uniref:hypothetical protein n=1 Tax=Haliscomenobacter sp. TaxID=2717303 RepID=UPI003364FE86